MRIIRIIKILEIKTVLYVCLLIQLFKFLKSKFKSIYSIHYLNITLPWQYRCRNLYVHLYSLPKNSSPVSTYIFSHEYFLKLCIHSMKQLRRFRFVNLKLNIKKFSEYEKWKNKFWQGPRNEREFNRFIEIISICLLSLKNRHRIWVECFEIQKSKGWIVRNFI